MMSSDEKRRPESLLFCIGSAVAVGGLLFLTADKAVSLQELLVFAAWSIATAVALWETDAWRTLFDEHETPYQ